MWLGGDDPDTSNRAFVYDVRTRDFREVSPVPATKQMDHLGSVGVLRDGSVIIAGGRLDNPTNHLSYRYHPGRDRWSRTDNLPEAQQWLYTPTVRLRDGRLLAAGGSGLDGAATGTGSLKAFVFDPDRRSTVPAIDPATGEPTGAVVEVEGAWDYTRTADGTESTLGCGHIFGNATLLADGRVLVLGGHTFWRPPPSGDDRSAQATDTHFFDPVSGRWTTGAPLPVVPGEDDRIAGSHGGRTNGVGVAVMDNGKVVIAGGTTHPDDAPYFNNAIGRQSILVMTPASDPMRSRYELVENRIPSGVGAGGLFGDDGRNQLLCYPLPGARTVIAGGQTTLGEDLFDTYLFEYKTGDLTRGPDLVHAASDWLAAHPEEGYPKDHEVAVISTRAVCMRSSRLVLEDGVLVHGGGYDPIVNSDETVGSRHVEQLSRGTGCQHHNPPAHPTEAQRAAARERYRHKNRH